MPLLYAIEGTTAPYEKSRAVAPASPLFATFLLESLGREPRRQAPEPGAAALKKYAEPAQAAFPAERKAVLVARDIMSRQLAQATSAMGVSAAKELMARLRIRHLPVVDGGRLSGIVSDRDLLAAREGELQLSVSAFMTVRVLTATPDTPVAEVASAMLTNHIHSMPIVDTQLRLVGLVTTSDILRAIARHAPLELWA